MTKLAFENPKVLRGTREIKRDVKMLSIFDVNVKYVHKVP
jgi:hypothetical protein